MKDRFLFRGKGEDGEWKLGYYLSNVTHSHPGGNVHAIGLINPENREQVLCDNIDPATIGQCTGVEDKHGRLIFEGDLLHWSKDGVSETGKVLWKTGGWAIFFGEHVNFMEFELLDADTGERIDWKIIGNIHDNPKLIKRRKCDESQTI